MEQTRIVDFLARFGHGARGVVYLIIGYFALLAALGSGATKNTEGVFQLVLAQHFGKLLLVILITGLFSFAVWRLIEAVFDADNRGAEAKGIAVRAGQFFSGLAYLALGASALGLMLSWDEGDDGNPADKLIAASIEQGWGLVALYTIAAIPVVVGIAQFANAYTLSYESRLTRDEDVLTRIRPVARTGLVARGLAFLILGGLIFWGGLSYLQEETLGIQEAFEALQRAPFGWAPLAVMGAGLIAFAAYCATLAVYWRGAAV